MTPEERNRDRAKVMAGTFVTALADVCPEISKESLGYIRKQLRAVLIQAQSIAITQAVEEERRECAAIAGTMAERPYDVDPEFSVCLHIESAIRQRGEE